MATTRVLILTHVPSVPELRPLCSAPLLASLRSLWWRKLFISPLLDLNPEGCWRRWTSGNIFETKTWQEQNADWHSYEIFSHVDLLCRSDCWPLLHSRSPVSWFSLEKTPFSIPETGIGPITAAGLKAWPLLSLPWGPAPPSPGDKFHQGFNIGAQSLPFMPLTYCSDISTSSWKHPQKFGP